MLVVTSFTQMAFVLVVEAGGARMAFGIAAILGFFALGELYLVSRPPRQLS